MHVTCKFKAPVAIRKELVQHVDSKRLDILNL